jgi:hypothetical protein
MDYGLQFGERRMFLPFQLQGSFYYRIQTLCSAFGRQGRAGGAHAARIQSITCSFSAPCVACLLHAHYLYPTRCVLVTSSYFHRRTPPFTFAILASAATMHATRRPCSPFPTGHILSKFGHSCGPRTQQKAPKKTSQLSPYILP